VAYCSVCHARRSRKSNNKVIEVRGEGVLASALGGDRMQRQDPGVPCVPNFGWEIWNWWDMEILIFMLCCSCCIGIWGYPLSTFYTFRFRPLKTCIRMVSEPKPIPFLRNSLWVCRIGLGAKVHWWRNPWRKGCVASLKDVCGEDRWWRLEALATATQDFHMSFSPRGLY
jgi:hypothetical protein